MSRLTPPAHRAVWLFVLLFASFTIGCSRYKTVHTHVYESKNTTVDLAHETVSGGMTVKKGFIHPQQVTTEDLTKVMGDLKYADPTFLWKEKDRPIFSSAEVQTLAPQISQALANATPDQMVAFSSRTWKKDLVFGSDKYTSGVLFFNDQGMNWAFGNVNLTEGKDGDIELANPLDAPPKLVRLSPQGSQAFYTPSQPRWYEAKVYRNWIVEPNPFTASTVVAAPLLPSATTVSEDEPVKEPPALADTQSRKPAPATDVAPASPPKPAAKSAPAKEVSDDASARLRRLKSLLDEKLISPQDYEQKKKEILKDL